MSEELDTPNNAPESGSESVTARLAEAHKNMINGVATPEDIQLVNFAENVYKTAQADFAVETGAIVDAEIVGESGQLQGDAQRVRDPIDLPVREVIAQPAIEAAPERLAIEAAPERLAIEGTPTRKAIESASEQLPEISFDAVRVKGTQKHVGEESIDRIEEQKAEIAATFEGLSKFKKVLQTIKMSPRMLKFSTLFKTETERKRGQEIQEDLLASEQVEATFDVGKFMSIIKGKGIADSRAQEQALFDAMSNDDFLRAGDTVERSETDSPIIADFRGKLKERLLQYLDSSADESLDDELQGELIADYDFDIQKLVQATMEANPGVFNPEDFMVMATTSFELAENSRAVIKHENGREQLENMLDTMKINMGQLQIGPNSNYNTEYLDRTIQQMRRRRVGSVIGKASFVAGTWLATGALAAGLSQQAVQSGSTSGLKYGLAAAGSVLGPVGAVAGFGIGVGASAFWGRYRARKGAAETIAHMEVKSGDSGVQETTELFQALQQDTVSYTVTTENLRSAFDLPEGVEDIAESTLRPDLSPIELQELISTIADVRVRLGVENATNAAVGSGNRESAINLFSGSDASSVQTERVQMIQMLQQAETQLRARYGEEGIPLAPRQNEAGEITFERTNLETVIAQASAEQATDLRARMAAVEQRRDAFIQSQGRRGAKVAGIISAGFGISGAAAAELLSHGAAPTIFDNVGMRGNTVASTVPTGGGSAEALSARGGNNTAAESVTTRNGNTVILQHPETGSVSNVEMAPSGREVTITMPDGQKVSYDINSHGLPKSAVTELQQSGIGVNQQVVEVPGKSVSQTDFIESKGGHTVNVRNWLADKESTQHEIRASYNKENGVYTLRYDSDDIASGDGASYNIPEQAAAGNLRLYYIDPATNKTVDVPFHVGKNGGIIVRTPESSDFHDAWRHDAEGRAFPKMDIRVGVFVDNDTCDSVATLKTNYNGPLDLPPSKQINIELTPLETPETTETAQSTGYTIPGFAFAGDHGNLYESKKDDSDEEDTPTPTPVPVTPLPPIPAPVIEPVPTRPELPPAPKRPELGAADSERQAITSAEVVNSPDNLKEGAFYNFFDTLNPSPNVYNQVRYLGRTQEGDYRFNDKNGELVYTAQQLRDGKLTIPNTTNNQPAPSNPRQQSVVTADLSGSLDQKEPEELKVRQNPQPQPEAIEPTQEVEQQPVPEAVESVPQEEPEQIEPESPQEQVTPLSPEQIIDKLSTDAMGLETTINGDPFIIDGKQTVDGQEFVRLMPRSGGDLTLMPLETFDSALRGNSVRFDAFLGTPDAGNIARDLRVGESLFDRSLGKNIVITNVNPATGITYRVVDGGRQAGSRAFNAVKADIESGTLRPGATRGVQLA